jgi:hypothetical protein
MALPLDTPSSPLTAPWHVLIAEDDQQISEFFANSVRRCPQLHLVAQAASVAQACQYFNALKTAPLQLRQALTAIEKIAIADAKPVDASQTRPR